MYIYVYGYILIQIQNVYIYIYTYIYSICIYVHMHMMPDAAIRSENAASAVWAMRVWSGCPGACDGHGSRDSPHGFTYHK